MEECIELFDSFDVFLYVEKEGKFGDAEFVSIEEDGEVFMFSNDTAEAGEYSVYVVGVN